MKNKKAVSLSFETIVVATIALTVLIVMILIITGTLPDLAGQLTGINSCENKNDRECTNQPEGKSCMAVGCPANQKWCCLKD